MGDVGDRRVVNQQEARSYHNSQYWISCARVRLDRVDWSEGAARLRSKEQRALPWIWSVPARPFLFLRVCTLGCAIGVVPEISMTHLSDSYLHSQVKDAMHDIKRERAGERKPVCVKPSMWGERSHGT